MKQALAIAVLLATLGVGALYGCAGTNAGDQTQAQAQSNAQKSDKKYRVVFHVTENNPQKWNIVLNNAGNVQENLGRDNVTIEIVTHGPGIDMLKAESKVAPRLAQALRPRVVEAEVALDVRQHRPRLFAPASQRAQEHKDRPRVVDGQRGHALAV